MSTDGTATNGPPERAPGVRSGPTLLQLARKQLRVDAEAFARQLRKLRIRNKWSVHDLAGESGVAASTISNLENEKSAAPDPEVTMALAQAFGFRTAGEMLAHEPRPRKTGPAAAGPPREAPGAAPGAGEAGGLSLDRLVEHLLRGVWRAQDARAAEAADGGEAGAAPGGLRRSAVSEVISLAVGVVVLVEPKAAALLPDAPGPSAGGEGGEGGAEAPGAGAPEVTVP